jgi:hypothetical protein
MFLFTRVLMSDVMLTLAVTAALCSLFRALEEDEPHPGRWAFLLAASLGLGVLIKGLVAMVLPAGAALAYLAATRQLFSTRTWQRLHPLRGLLVVLFIAAPWHVLATLRNPPYFDFTLHSGPGQYRGFFWFYFINEHLLRFLDLRYPRDYNTVPRLYFWLLHLLWLFPWSFLLPAVARLSYKPVDRAGRARLLALCWAGFVLLFFSFSTTQEYYSMPAYPAFALLLGTAIASQDAWVRRGARAISITAAVVALSLFLLLYFVRAVPTPGDISAALAQHPEAYTLSLGHMGDLTISSFAYLRLPIVLAGTAFLLGALGAWRLKGQAAILALALMMTLFAQAARQALVVFNPYLSSQPLAEALLRSPDGRLIIDGAYYPFSSVFFYSNRSALLLNGRINNLEYGSYAPGAPPVFIDDAEFQRLWPRPERFYLVAFQSEIPRLERLVGNPALHPVAESGGKFLFTNHKLESLAISHDSHPR